MVLDRGSFGLGIKMRSHSPDHLNRPHPVRNRHHGVSIDALARRPVPPLAVDGLRGIAQNSIQIEQNGRTLENRHPYFSITSRGTSNEPRAARNVEL